MKLPLKPHLLALLCSAGLFGASGVLFVKSQVPSAAEAPVAAPPTAPVPPQPTPAPATTPTYSAAQIDQWVAPIALYPDALLSQILMASTYPMNMVQAAQWSQDHPTLQGDAAIQAGAGQPWDASVKSLVAFPQLMALLGQNPPWIQNLGDAFLAQPDDVMASVQRLRALAQQTGALTSSPQQKVTTITRTAPPVSPEKPAAAPRSSTVIEIEPASPEMVYVPTYNPATVYGTWQNPAREHDALAPQSGVSQRYGQPPYPCRHTASPPCQRNRPYCRQPRLAAPGGGRALSAGHGTQCHGEYPAPGRPTVVAGARPA